jgi:hypothetical protein
MEENALADLLSKLASTKKTSNYHSVVEEVIPYPSLTLQVQEADWRTPLMDYIQRGIIPEHDKESKKIIKKATRFTTIEGHLFSKGISTPLLKCIGPEKVGYVLAEIHKGSCGHHVRAKSLARKALRAGYFWPTMSKNVNSVNDMPISPISRQKSCIPYPRHGPSTLGEWTS